MKSIVIQNVDRTITRKDYETMNSDELLVTSMFRTIQGEGPFAGHPAIFLRLAGCNFGAKDNWCQGCDTSFQFDQGRRIAFHDLTVELMALPGYTSRDILVITGGEPTLQDNLLQFIIGTTLSYPPIFSMIQIETNGTQTKFFADLDKYEDSVYNGEWYAEPHYKRPSIVVSPKANLKVGRYAEPSKLVQRLASCFKFVLTADESDPHHTVPDWALFSGKTVYVSPMAVYKKAYQGEVSSAWDHDLIDAEKTAANYHYAAQYALKHNLLLSIQQHLFCSLA